MSKTSCLFIATSARTNSSNVKSGSYFAVILSKSFVGLLPSSESSKFFNFSTGILSSAAKCLQLGDGGSLLSNSLTCSTRSESSRTFLNN